MPNWCNTNYKLVGDSDEIADLHKKLKELEDMPKPLVDNGFGNLFLGCIINHLGGDYESVDCRGEIDYMELCGENMLQLTTTTAWGDKSEVFDFLCEKYPSIECYYLSEEPGMGYYINSDTSGEYFPEKFIIDDHAQGADYANDEEDLFAQIADRIEVDSIKNFEELSIYLELFNEENPRDEIYYHEFTNP